MNSSRLLRAGAVFHWTPTTFADAYRDFTITGVLGIVNGVASFGGSTYFSTRWNPSGLGAFSIGFKYYHTTASSLKYVFDNTNGSAGIFAIKGYSGANDKLTIGVFSTASFKTAQTADLVNGTWYEIIVTWDGRYVTIYVNGSQSGTIGDVGFASQTIVASTTNVVLGADYAGASGATFKIKDFFIFQRVLSATEIANISEGDPFPWPKIVYHNYNIDGVTKTHEPFSSAQLTNIIANLKSDGASALGLTTLDIADISREYGVA